MSAPIGWLSMEVPKGAENFESALDESHLFEDEGSGSWRTACRRIAGQGRIKQAEFAKTKCRRCSLIAPKGSQVFA